MSTPGLPPPKCRVEHVQCAGKQRFETFDLAGKVVRSMGRHGDGASQPYRCVHCKLFHIGGTGLKGQKRQARARRLRLGELKEQA